MTERTRPEPCYRDRDTGVRFIRNGHRHDCAEAECRGCKPCPEKHHCTARRNCTWHLSEGELTCGRCINGVRIDLKWIVALSALLMTQAIADGLESEAANLAGPAVDPEAWSWRKVAAKQGIAPHLSLVEEDDEHHPLRVLGGWERMIREDYGHEPGEVGCEQRTIDRREWERHVDRDRARASCASNHGARCWDVGEPRTSIARASAYLERNLHRVANDDEQDFPLLRSELKKCRQHLEAVLHNDTRPDRGLPCPLCRAQGEVVRLERHYSHWCESDDCQAFHHTDDSADVWQCPRNAEHWWGRQGYADLERERRAE